MNNKILFFDIETEANPEGLSFMPEPSAPANYKDADKIAQYIAEKKLEQTAQAALDADYGKIIAISVKTGVDGENLALLVGDEEAKTERSLLSWFWSAFYSTNGVSCGYNTIGFDLPYLQRRSMDLGVIIPCKPFIAKYRTEPTLDLMGVLYNWGPAKGLKFVCKRYGIDNPLPELNGSQVAGMDKDTLRKYVANDVDLTVKLYQRMLGVYF
jgi:predicted PolB exonuclease-like 3'-5' exonuclease